MTKGKRGWKGRCKRKGPSEKKREAKYLPPRLIDSIDNYSSQDGGGFQEGKGKGPKQ